MIKTLVILTTHFGTNFSGGSTATCEIFSRLEKNFKEVIVVCNKLGQHSFSSAKFVNYSSWTDAMNIVKSLNSEHTIFYGDFYNAIIFVLLKIPFFFTYHDNWPELRTTSIQNGFRSLYYTNIYKQIFRNASTVFTVSAFKAEFIGKYTKQVRLIRNGFNITKRPAIVKERRDIIMVGTVDDRKYRLAIPLFKLLHKGKENGLSIDIYGKIADQSLAKRLSNFPFVQIKGFSKSIPYHHYGVLLHTSLMENLPLVYCEAIYHGLRIVGFDVGGAREIVNSKVGVLIAPYQLETMLESLLKLRSKSAKIEYSGEVPAEYSWDMASQNYLRYMV